MNPKQLFVYGTLRHDLGYSGLAPEAKAGPICHVKNARMYHLGGFPGVVPVPEAAACVTGQLLTFHHLTDEQWQAVLRRLDRYEGAPRLYYRTREAVYTDRGAVEEAFIYFFAEPSRITDYPVVPDGDWASVMSRRL